MIDVHCHALYGVDDGAGSLEESLTMLRDAKAQGIRAMILTPHLRHGMFSYPKERILEHFEILKPKAQAMGLTLYLGCEHHTSSNMLKELLDGVCFPLAEGNCVLTEYSYETAYSDIKASVRELASNSYIPVIAHAERCLCVQREPEKCRELAEAGAYIQLNADSILRLAGKAEGKASRKILKHHWAHLVASDAHKAVGRINRLGACRQFVASKYGEAYAGRLFEGNPREIIT